MLLSYSQKEISCIYPEFPISTLSLRRIIRQLPCRFKLRSPWHLLGGIGACIGRRVAHTSVCDVCGMLTPLEAEVESSHASAAAFLRPQSSSLRDHQHPAGRDRARLFGSERFKRKFVTTLADLRGELGFRIVGDVPIRQLTDCHLLL